MIGHRPALSVTTEHQPYNIKSTHLGNQSVTLGYYQTQAIFLLNRTTFCDPFLSKWTYSGNLSSCLYQHHLAGLCTTSCVHKRSSCTRWQEQQARLPPCTVVCKVIKESSSLWAVAGTALKGNIPNEANKFTFISKAKTVCNSLWLTTKFVLTKLKVLWVYTPWIKFRRRKLDIPCLY